MSVFPVDPLPKPNVLVSVVNPLKSEQKTHKWMRHNIEAQNLALHLLNLGKTGVGFRAQDMFIKIEYIFSFNHFSITDVFIKRLWVLNVTASVFETI